METILLGAIGVCVVILAAVLFAPSAEPRTTTVTYNDDGDEFVTSYGDTSPAPVTPVTPSVQYPVAVGDSIYLTFDLFAARDDGDNLYAWIGTDWPRDIEWRRCNGWVPVVGVGALGVTVDASGASQRMYHSWPLSRNIPSRMYVRWACFNGQWDRATVDDSDPSRQSDRYARRAEYGDMS